MQNGIILTWNPIWWNAWEPPYDEQRAQLLRGHPVNKTRWSVGRHRHGIVPGMHAWLYRQGNGERGIHAFATVESEPYEDLHWRREDRLAIYVDVTFTELLPVADLIPTSVLEDVAPRVPWRSMRQSGTLVDVDSVHRLDELWREWSSEVNSPVVALRYHRKEVSMRHVKVHEAKTQLSKLLTAVERGEHVIIERGNTPVARLVPLDASLAPRRVGFLAGSMEIPEDLQRRLHDERWH